MLPKSVIVKGTKYKIILRKLSPELCGECCKQSKTIYINTFLKNPISIYETYVHELCHAYICEYNLDMVVSHEIEELFCMMFEDVTKNTAKFTIENKRLFK